MFTFTVPGFSGNIENMGKAGDALRQTLEDCGISQNQLAIALNAKRTVVNRWFHGQVDPTAETVVDIAQALEGINPDASQQFVRLYLGDWMALEKIAPVEPAELPPSEDVDVAALSGLFADTTNSYKYLFFLSLLDILRRRQFEVLSSISFEEIVVEMLANAWYPHTYFKLSFGTQDQIDKHLNSLNLEISEPILSFTDTDKKLLRKAIAAQNLKDIVSHLSRYVPFRLIAPFLEQELKAEGISRGRGNKLEVAMPELAGQYFNSKKPLYCFDSRELKHCQAIVIHPSWAEYLEKNYAIVRAWAAWEWLEYMQKRNPNTPALVNKLFMPSKREPLSTQTKYWQLTLKQHPETRCIYSGEILDPSRFDLNHYLPWSFVGHDRLWNLIPVVPKVSSAKSNNLPSSQYFYQFVDLQHLGLVTSHDLLSEKSWNNYIEAFLGDLNLSTEDLLDRDRLMNAYESAIDPLLGLAKNQGFSQDWVYLS